MRYLGLFLSLLFGEWTKLADAKPKGSHMQCSPCILVLLDVQRENEPGIEKWQCQLMDEDVVETGRTFVDIEGDIPEDIESGDQTLYVPDADIVDGVLVIPPGAFRQYAKAPSKKKKKNKDRRQRGLRLSGDSELLTDQNHRGLLPTKEALGSRSVLMVRVNAKDNTNPISEADLRAATFGGGLGASTNSLKERMESCSYNDLTITPANEGNNGVISITVNENSSGETSANFDNKAVAELKSKLGFGSGDNLEDYFDHVMFCLPPGTKSGWIGYAWVNSWMSVFNSANNGNDWCTPPSIQVHEIGHNLGLHHAWESGKEYQDNTGIMGTSYQEEPGRPSTNLCFNPSRAWDLGWYKERRAVINVDKAPVFQGRLIGINDYETPEGAGAYTVIKIVGSSTYDLYLGYNVKAGINSDTREYANRVTVTRVNPSGDKDYSDLRHTLSSSGETYTYNSFHDGRSVRIAITDKGTDGEMPYVDVSISLSCSSDNQCSVSSSSESCSVAQCSVGRCFLDRSACTPTKTPTQFPTQVPAPTLPLFPFRLELELDWYTEDQSWELLDICNNNAAVLSGGDYDDSWRFQTDVVTADLPASSYNFTMYDAWGDGLTAGPDGKHTSYRVYYEGVEVESETGPFGFHTSTVFGDPCPGEVDTTQSPTQRPSKSPSIMPTTSPSAEPSSSPSQPPTKGPTARPSSLPSSGPSTAQPSSLPSSTPSKDPTNQPVSAPINARIPDATALPSLLPSSDPTSKPTSNPTKLPSAQPSSVPSHAPSQNPSIEPSSLPSSVPSEIPTPAPVPIPTLDPNPLRLIPPTPFQLKLELDWYTEDQSWELLDMCNNNAVVLSGGDYNTTWRFQTDVVTADLPASSYNFTMYDAWGDGLTAGQDGKHTSYRVYFGDDDVVSETGNFGFHTSTVFGYSCSSGIAITQSPIATPTDSPVASPTPSPVAPPTPTPVAPPTPTPVAPPTSPPVAPVSWTEIFNESFEDGFGEFVSNGKETKVDDKEASAGSFSLVIKDDKDTSWSRTTLVDVSSYDSLRISFAHYTEQAEDGEAFYLECSTDGLQSWQIVQTFTAGDCGEFCFQDKTWQTNTKTWSVDGVDTAYIRFRSGFNDGKEKVMLDEVRLEGKSGSIII